MHWSRSAPDHVIAWARVCSIEPFAVRDMALTILPDLAWHEMRVLLATVVLSFDLKLCEESQDWDDQKVFTLWEKKPLVCTLTAINA